MDDVRNTLAAACRERGITGPADFHARFGVAPAVLTPHAALVVVETSAWVTEIWIPNAGVTRIVWVPEAVRAYAAVFGIHQRDGESDHEFTMRMQATIKQRMEETECPTKTRTPPVRISATASGLNEQGGVQPMYNPSPCPSD